MSHYFINDKDLKSNKFQFKYSFNGLDFIMKSDYGVFSKNELDYGTLLLLETIKNEPLKGRILDLGCGIGCLSISLAKVFKDIQFEAVDINTRAVNLCKENCKLNSIENLKVYESDICLEVEGLFDYIVTNPPIRAGKKVVFDFFLQAFNHLRKDGCLYVVNRKSHGAESSKKRLEEIFQNCQVIEKKKGFYILKSKKVDK